MPEFSMSLGQPFAGLVAAIAAGLLVGLERGWTQRDFGAGRRVAGFRTFGLIGLLGGLAGLGPDILAAASALGVAAVLAIGYARSTSEQRVSATTTIAGLLTFAAGFSATRMGSMVGLAAAAATFAILSARHSLHALLRGLQEEEIEGVARFVLVALVVLPLLPDANFGPYEAWNPRRIWMVVVMVTGLSFVGYVAARRFGSSRGILAVAITGALVSSTAVTADYARRLRSEPDAAGPLIAGIAIASIVMFVRVQILTLVLAPRAAPTLAFALAPATLVATLFALAAWRRQGGEAKAVSLGNPFSFGPALLLAGLVAVLSVAARWALELFGSQGMAIVLGLTGMTDVDAAVMTLSNLPEGVIDSHTAGLVLAVPVLANTAIKAGMAQVIAWGHGGLRAAFPLWAALVASAATMLIWTLG